MTGDPTAVFGPLGRRLLAAFAAVALSSVAMLTVAALIGTDRGLATAERANREAAAARTAVAAADGYPATGGWAAADLTAARAVAEAAGAQLVIRDATGAMVWPGRAPAGSGPMRGAHHNATGTVATATVRVAGQDVGTVELLFGRAPETGGRAVAWQWVAAAGAAALLLALAVSWYVARRLSVPLVAVTRAARAFAGGDRAVRARLRAPGELGELASAVDAMADQVTQAEQVRRQLSADVAHELRTPLTSLQAGLEELRDGLAEPDPARLARLHDQSLRLGRVVEDLAELSAAESSALSLRRADVDLADIVTAALDGHESRLRSAGLHVDRDIHSPVPVHADPDRLHQAVTNLLTNTARYCRPGDQVQVSVDTVDHHARIRVVDTGPGIEPADLPHVFDRFWRGRNSRSTGGAGIGLAVVRELVVAHGGTVDAQSRPGHGSTFTIRLPLAPAMPAGNLG
ncbi:two-component system sensor histidine kinase BaeS [Micromonospora sp. Llam0]|uniref:sensor histidine kinase n=1 Tax=Micromonospora sp. Llam0 TaxID=2485143 RepID=UPI000FBECC84|nr:HAMP domain-containing sensor histidine kinase [Micromonospora sp. Llam0]ROO63306.1 two-component system sensor histidine kinase BaeS [Micromonospora sp. Llam0]